MLFINKRVKTITTIGPASETRDLMLRLAQKGANVYRLNFSHGDFEEHGKRVEFAKSIIQQVQRPLSLILDTKGPEIRTHSFKGGEALISKDSRVIIYTNKEIEGTETEFSINYENLVNDIQVEQRLLVDDGKLQLIVLGINNKDDDTSIICRAVNTHLVKNHRAIIVSGIKLSLPFISDKDRADLIFGCEQKVDYVAASFVHDAKDLQEMRQLLDENGGADIKIIAKIESRYAVDNIDEIIANSDGIMIARGDLGVDVPYAEVPLIQKHVIRKCNKAMVPVIVATQMLESMLSNPLPSRAEVSDIYWAVDLGADTTMLSGETANGEYPEKSIEAMTRVVRKAEIHFWYEGYLERFIKWSTSPCKDFVYQVGKEVLGEKIQKQKRIHQVIVLDDSDDQLLTKTLSNARVRSTLIPLVTDERIRNSFGIWYGVYPELVMDINKVINDDSLLNNIARKYGAKTNEQVLIVNGNEMRKLQIK